MSWRSHSVEYLSDNLFFETLLSSTTSHSASIYILRPKSRLSQSYDTRHDILQLSSAHSSSLQLSSALFSSLQLTMVWSFRPQRGTIQRYCNISNMYLELLWFAEAIKKSESQAIGLIRKRIPEVW